MKTVSEALKESDKLLLELEEKWVKFEEQQRREERQFQLQMMQMLVGSTHPPSHPPTHPNDPHAQYFPMFRPYCSQPSQHYPRSGETEDS